ncbi:glycosyltransferase family protein [Terricaulis silvestris]|uniref:Uncharacterized protein n=1 Tax=Terricaulis silvestris TaxID=2686094 RepID=A0A6I6MY32_9CAUL|nr:hypothetical protein [Terricaulis silvestris]QGZ96552.1 hypothetical protein DSM104635_03412 [Terricaulis silvestris]
MRYIRYGSAVLVLLFLLCGLAIALWPEPAPRALVSSEGWLTTDQIGRVDVGSLPETIRQTHRSLQSTAFRTWTPESGARRGEVVSPGFQISPVMAVTIAGSTATADGGASVSIVCDSHTQSLPVFRGNVNTHFTEAIFEVDEGWCPGEARLQLRSREPGVNVGVGTVAEVSRITLWKRSAIGLFPFLVLAFVVLGALSIVGVLVARAARLTIPAAFAGLTTIGVAGLATFLAYTLGPSWDYGSALAILLVLLLGGIAVALPRALRQAVIDLSPAGAVWLLSATAFFFLSTLAYNGLGHWEPNYRFSPAHWSSDNELPWMFAETLRHNWNTEGVLGPWSFSDRPPLMTGALLLTADLFDLLQTGNDGNWLRGPAHNTSSILINTLWAPVFFTAAKHLFKLDTRVAALATLITAIIPFFVFNSIYGWPKLFGAAFAGVAIWSAIDRRSSIPISDRAVAFGLASALSILSHASNAIFLLPLALYFLPSLLRAPKALIGGVLAGLVMLAPWIAYQHFILPSNDPLLKYALTGDFGFAEPARTTLESARAFYAQLSLESWLQTKAAMAAQLFWPASTPLSQPPIHTLFGMHGVDALRQWDFYFLSAGNALLLAAAIVSAFKGRRDDNPIGALLCVTGSSYLLILLVFFHPLILHHAPYGALIALALAGFGGLAAYAPGWLRGIGLLAGIYGGVVWGLSPLRSALSIDLIAALGLAFCLGAALCSTLSDSRSTSSVEG